MKLRNMIPFCALIVAIFRSTSGYKVSGQDGLDETKNQEH
jgi:hypothetical protein